MSQPAVVLSIDGLGALLDALTDHPVPRPQPSSADPAPGHYGKDDGAEGL